MPSRKCILCTLEEDPGRLPSTEAQIQSLVLSRPGYRPGFAEELEDSLVLSRPGYRPGLVADESLAPRKSKSMKRPGSVRLQSLVLSRPNHRPGFAEIQGHQIRK